MTPKFTFVIPVYKVEQYLDRCIQSVLGQTYANIEVILVDDGSPDACPKMCDTYALQDSRIKVIHKENGGLSDARNAGVCAAGGEYIIFLDSDDYVTVDACDKLAAFTENHCDILVCDGECDGAEMMLQHPFETGICSGEAFLKTAFQHRAMPMAAVLYVYKRSFLIENDLRFKKGILHEDEQFTPRAFLKAKTVVNTYISFYRYVLREDSITTARDLRKNGADIYDTCQELLVYYQKVQDVQLRDLLIDSLVSKYMSVVQAGRLYRYGKAYIHKAFVWKQSKRARNKLKALLFCVSPRIYWHINNISKKLSN